MTRFWIPAALLVVTGATLLACGGDTKAGAGTSGDAGATIAGRKLSDCEYATALLKSLETFSASAPSLTTIANTETALQAFDTFDSELGTLIGELQSYRLSAEVAAVNNGVITIFEDARKQIPELKGAIRSGDTTRLTTAGVTLSQGIVPRMEAIQQQHPRVMDKLNQCDTA
ncbi:MAG: hypothetical protein ACRDJ9_24695 [Dehalococcoidia bacterium]